MGNTVPRWKKSQYNPSQMEKINLSVCFTVHGCAALSSPVHFKNGVPSVVIALS